MSTTLQNAQSTAPPTALFHVPLGSAGAGATGLLTPRSTVPVGLFLFKSRIAQHLPRKIFGGGSACSGFSAEQGDQHAGRTGLAASIYPLFAATGLVAATTVGLILGRSALPVGHVIFVFLVPALICAMQWGWLPAFAAALIGIGADRFVFEARPLTTIGLPETIDIVLFGVIAATASCVGGRLRLQMIEAKQHAKEVQRKDREIGAVHRYARKLMAAGTVSDVHSILRNYCSKELNAKTFIIGNSDPLAPGLHMHDCVELPKVVRREASRLSRAAQLRSQSVLDEKTRHRWLVRAFSSRMMDNGIIAVDLGNRLPEATDAIGRSIEAAICDAAAMIEHLEVARLIRETNASQRRGAAGAHALVLKS